MAKSFSVPKPIKGITPSKWYAGQMADIALSITGGKKLNHTVVPAPPKLALEYLAMLQEAAEKYNEAILEEMNL